MSIICMGFVAFDCMPTPHGTLELESGIGVFSSLINALLTVSSLMDCNVDSLSTRVCFMFDAK